MCVYIPMYIFKAFFVTTRDTSETSPPVLYDYLLPVMNGINYHISGNINLYILMAVTVFFGIEFFG